MRRIRRKAHACIDGDIADDRAGDWILSDGRWTGAWTKVKIDVRGERARLYVHGHEQPTLIVNDLKTGAQGRGGVAPWIDRGTVAHFRNLSVETSAKDGSK